MTQHYENLKRATESHRAMRHAMRDRSLELAAELEDERQAAAGEHPPATPEPLGDAPAGDPATGQH